MPRWSELARAARLRTILPVASTVACLASLLIVPASADAPPLPPAAPGSATSTAKPAKPPVRPPLSIVENQGQVDPAVKFYLAGPKGTVFFTPTEVVFNLVESAPKKTSEPDKTAETADGVSNNAVAPKPQRGVVIRLSFPGADPAVRLEGVDELPGRINDLRGNDPAKWRKGIKTFARVIYRDLYPGVDLEYRGAGGALQRVLRMKDPAQVSQLRMKYAGVDSVRMAPDGALELVTVIGSIREEKIAMQDSPDQKSPASTLEYKLLEGGLIGLAQ